MAWRMATGGKEGGRGGKEGGTEGGRAGEKALINTFIHVANTYILYHYILNDS